MSPGVDRELLADRAAAVGRPSRPGGPPPAGEPAELRPETAATDTVILHLWQAVQVVIDLAVSTCVRLGVGSPPTYADAFRRLADAQIIQRDLADQLARAAGFRNLVVHAYGRLDLQRVHATAVAGPADLRAFLVALRDYADGADPVA